MSLPRQILRGTTYLITRRTLLRHMLLRPDAVMNRIIHYLLGIAADRSGVQIHAFCAMSTHIHLVVTDVRGELPRFLHFFHLFVARCIQVHRAWNDPVWDKEPTSVVRLETPAVIVEKIAYVLANPVAAGLVQRAHEWPGASVHVHQLGHEARPARRPHVYLNPKSPVWPEEIPLPLPLPPGIAPEKAASFREQVATEVRRLEQAAADVLRENRQRVLGANQAQRVSPRARAKGPEATVARNPTFAVGRKQRDAWHRAIDALQAFRESYRAALEQWWGGARDVVFPAGTWWMQVFHRATVEEVATAPG